MDRMDPSPTLPGRATIRDVSRVAGVSIKTVSRVINNQDYVSAGTRARVQQVIDQLGFQPSFAARALAGHRSHQIAVICNNPSAWYVYEIQYGVRVRCQQSQVRMIAQLYDSATQDLSGEVMSLVDQVHPDGLVLTPPACDDPHMLDELQRRLVPIVRIQPGTRPGFSSSACIDNEAAGCEMTQYLLSLGHKRIAFIVGDRGYMSSENRLVGYQRALTEAGIAVREDYIRQGLFDFQSGERECDALLSLAEPPTAIFAGNDSMAAGVLVAAHRRGIRVPEQLSVAGFDDITFAESLWPALTTMRQPVRALAAAAAELLLNPSGQAQNQLIAHTLVVRDSTGPAPAA